jgi:hypothetical protein
MGTILLFKLNQVCLGTLLTRTAAISKFMLWDKHSEAHSHRNCQASDLHSWLMKTISNPVHPLCRDTYTMALIKLRQGVRKRKWEKRESKGKNILKKIQYQRWHSINSAKICSLVVGNMIQLTFKCK